MSRRSTKTDPELQAHKEWLGYLQPRGLVVAPAATQEDCARCRMDRCCSWLRMRTLEIQHRQARQQPHQLAQQRYDARCMY